MEFTQLVHGRHMVRHYTSTPVSRSVLNELIDLARRAPSAGFSQGQEFLVLDQPADVARFWEVTASAEDLAQPSAWLRGMRTAPALVLCLADTSRYASRYAQADKQRRSSDLGTWDVPYWDTDAAMSAMILLLGCVDRGLGSCFFALPSGRAEAVAEAFALPASHRIVGVVSIGHPEQGGSKGSSTRPRRELGEVLHWGRWVGED